MSDVKLTDEETAYIKRPLTEDEQAATRRMPAQIARGWVIRKRAGELARKRGEAREGRIQAAFVQLAEAMSEPQ